MPPKTKQNLNEKKLLMMLLFFKNLRIYFLKIVIIILVFDETLIMVANAQNNQARSDKNLNNTLSKPSTSRHKTLQTKIRSDIIDIKQKSKKIDFINNVIVEKQDTSILANNMTVFYRDKNDKNISDSNSSNIKEIKAFGNVKMFNDEFTASSDYAIFEPNKNYFIMHKNVIVNNGTSVLKGEKFIYNFNTKNGQIFGSKNLENKNINSSKFNNTDKALIKPDNRVTVIIGNDINEQQKIFNKK